MTVRLDHVGDQRTRPERPNRLVPGGVRPEDASSSSISKGPVCEASSWSIRGAGASSCSPDPAPPPGLRAPDPMTAVLTEGYGHFAVTTPELDPVHEALVARGARGSWRPGPSPEPGVRMAWVSDPEGNLIELIEKNAE
ncbi:VOC family protein [Streptomyces sp. L7]